MSNITVRFLGGAGTVTGSKFLVEGGGRRVMVDCGMFQGLKDLRLLNWAPFPVKCDSIDDVILTHAHLDHTGYLPLLVKNGFKGTIHCSEPTRALTEILLRDTAKIQEEDARHANMHGYTKHKPALPLYDTYDVERVLPLIKTRKPGAWINLGEEIRFRFLPSGHILGSVFVELDCDKRRLVFTGDLGRKHPLTLNPPVQIPKADYLFIESTYGDRKHQQESVLDHLRRIICETVQRKGTVLIPSFAVGRTQDVLHLIAQLKISKSISDVPIFLDSPMAIRATKVFDQYSSWHKLNKKDLGNLEGVAIMTAKGDQSRKLQMRKKPAIIIAGSGMLTGGRILYHLETRISDERNSIVLVGYQAAGTLGRFLKDGTDELKIHGHYLPVKARIEEISSLSAHADQGEILEWLGGFKQAPKKVFIIHGEPHAADALRVRIQDRFGWDSLVAKLGETRELP